MRDATGPYALFAYGSLQIDAVMEAVTGGHFVGRPARLAGFRRSRLAGRSYPGVIADSDASTSGVVFDGLGAGELDILDLFEGEPYVRQRVEIEVDAAPDAVTGPTRHAAFVYVVRDEWASLLTTEEWNLDAFREQSLGAFLDECRVFRRDALRGGRWTGPENDAKRGSGVRRPK